MRTNKKYSLLILFIIAIASLGLTFGIGLSQVNNLVKADPGPGNPNISAIAENPISTSAIPYMGTVTVNYDALGLDGTDSHDKTPVGMPVNIKVNPGTHFKINGGIRILTGEVVDGEFVDLGLTAPTLTTVDAHNFSFTPEDYDYQIVVNLVPKTYELQLSTGTYHSDDHVDAATEANQYFTADNGIETADAESVTKLQIQWGTKVNLFGETSGSTANLFKYIGCEMKYNKVADTYNTINSSLITFERMLDDYVLSAGGRTDVDGIIELRGIYCELVEVTLNVSSFTSSGTSSTAPQNNVRIISTSKITGEETKYTAAGTYYFEKDSVLVVVAESTPGFTFKELTVNPGGKFESVYVNTKIGTGTETHYDIEAVFTTADFRLVLQGVDHLGNPVNLGSNLKVSIDGGALTSISQDGIGVNSLAELAFRYTHALGPNYIFEGFYFLRGSEEVPVEFSNGVPASIAQLNQMSPFIINDQFIKNYTADNKIVFTAKFTKLFALDISYPTDAGNVSVYKNGSLITLTPSTKYFLESDQIKIVVAAKKYHTFSAFSGANRDADQSAITVTYATMGRSDKDIVVFFDADIFKINETEEFLLSHTEISVGTPLTITYSGNASGVINGWTINGKELSYFSSTVQRNGRVVTLTVDAEFIDKFVNANWITNNTEGQVLTFDNKVTTAMGTGTLIAIVTPSVAIPLVLGILLYFVLVNNKRKKVIRATLTDQLSREVKMNTGKFVADLREGKTSGTVTDEDVKRAMKEQKQEKKAQIKAAPTPAPAKEAPKVQQQAPAPASKPAPTPAPTPAPAQAPKTAPTQTSAIILDGGAILQDRSVVDKNKAKIGTLQNDGSIANASGKAFAKVDFTTGNITDNAGNLLGKVQGDGSIKK